jgi:hypothetical protein
MLYRQCALSRMSRPQGGVSDFGWFNDAFPDCDELGPVEVDDLIVLSRRSGSTPAIPANSIHSTCQIAGPHFKWLSSMYTHTFTVPSKASMAGSKPSIMEIQMQFFHQGLGFTATIVLGLVV